MSLSITINIAEEVQEQNVFSVMSASSLIVQKVTF